MLEVDPVYVSLCILQYFWHFAADLIYMYAFKRQYSVFLHVWAHLFTYVYIYITSKPLLHVLCLVYFLRTFPKLLPTVVPTTVISPCHCRSFSISPSWLKWNIKRTWTWSELKRTSAPWTLLVLSIQGHLLISQLFLQTWLRPGWMRGRKKGWHRMHEGEIRFEGSYSSILSKRSKNCRCSVPYDNRYFWRKTNLD